MKPVRRAIAPLLALAATLPGPAQDPAPVGRQFSTLENGLRYRCVPGEGDSVHAVLCVAAGSHHDPIGKSGMAAALGALLRRAPRSKGTPPLQVDVRGAFTLVSTSGTAKQLGACITALAATLPPGPSLDTDAVEQATGMAALLADDATQIFPGPMLRIRAARHLLAGTPDGRALAGIPADLRTIDDAELQAWHRAAFRPGRAVLVVVGSLDAEQASAAARNAFAPIRRARAPLPTKTVHEDSAIGAAETEHVRVAGPFVSLALRAPTIGDDDHLAFAVAMEAVRQRAARELAAGRGAEIAANFTPFHYEPFEGAPLVMINRRGRDSDDAGLTRIELAGFLDRALSPGLRDEEISAAAARLARRLRPTAGTLPARTRRTAARTLAIAEALGWPWDLADRVGRVTPKQARRSLGQHAREGARRWFALLPPRSQGN